MHLKNIDTNKIIEHKKRIDRHKQDTENKEKIAEKTKTKGITKDKVVKVADAVTEDKTTNNVTTDKKKRITRKKPSKEYIDGIKKRAEERAYRIIEGTEEEFHEHREEPTHEISKEERAERFKKLHEMVVQMTKKRKENK